MHLLALAIHIPFVLRIPAILAEPWFKYLLLPVLGLLGGAVVKSLYRKDDREWAKEDFAWGPDLVTSACVMMLLLTADRAASYVNLLTASSPGRDAMLEGLAQIVSPFLVFLLNGAVLVFLTLWIRRKGWQDENKLLLATGFVAPWIVGVAAVGISFFLAVL